MDQLIKHICPQCGCEQHCKSSCTECQDCPDCMCEECDPTQSK